MDPFALTRSLIDIESITGREKAAGEFLFATLSKLAASTAGAVEQMEVSPDRFNVLATWGTPVVTLSTHMTRCRRFFLPARMTSLFAAAARAIRRESSRQ